MKHLNQIILCSESEGRSFLRELAVFDEFAIVTHVEALPFRYHETLKKLKNPKGDIVRLTVPVERTNRHSGCPFCGTSGTFQCSNCGYVSCHDTALPGHLCPGCKKSFKTKTADAKFASGSGFVNDGLRSKISSFKQEPSFEVDLWNRSHSKLLKLIHDKNSKQE